jgi:farnesyl diphosphate synthase
MAAELFRAFFPRILEIARTYLLPRVPAATLSHSLELLEYSTRGGKQIRGVFCALSYLELTGLSPESSDADIGYILGWALEVSQGSYLVADDLMDQSLTRRGQTCWYRLPNIGAYAANDALLLEQLTFVVIESLRGRLPDSVIDAIIDAVHKVNVATNTGQSFDGRAVDFTYDCYRLIVENKTSHYTVWLPYMVGMLASQKVPADKLAAESLRKLFMELGFYFQVQDDYLDVYGDPAQTGKIGTDIYEGKVTWLACTAFKLANEDQKAVIRANMRVNQENVIAIYNQLDLAKHFEEFAQKEAEALEKGLEGLDSVYPKKTIATLLASLTKRRS